MVICSNCLGEIISLPTFLARESMWQLSDPSFIVCCDCPSPIEIEDGELEDYKEAYNNLELDPDDLTDKEMTILKYLEREGLIANTKIFEDESAYAMVRDKQLELDLFRNGSDV